MTGLGLGVAGEWAYGSSSSTHHCETKKEKRGMWVKDRMYVCNLDSGRQYKDVARLIVTIRCLEE